MLGTFTLTGGGLFQLTTDGLLSGCVCLGSSFTKLCRVFVPSVGWPIVDVIWFFNNDFVSSTQPSDRIYTAEQKSEPSAVPFFITAAYCL